MEEDKITLLLSSIVKGVYQKTRIFINGKYYGYDICRSPRFKTQNKEN